MSSKTLAVLSVSLAVVFTCFPDYSLAIQEIETEFRHDAPRTWLKLRRNAFESAAIAVENRSAISKPKPNSDETQIRDTITRYKLFSDGDFKYHEATPVSDSDTKVPLGRRVVNIHNSEETFLVYKDPNSDWVRMAVEESPKQYDFVEASISGVWFQKQRRGALNALSARMGDDPRLNLGGQPIEHFVENYRQLDEKCFRDFKVVNDKVFGRIVSIKTRLRVEVGSANIRDLESAATKTVTGELEFLADWKWLPRRATVTTTFLNKHENEINKRTRVFEAIYDSTEVEKAKTQDRDLWPTKVKISFKSEANKRSSDTQFTIRQLTAEEIKMIKESSRLADYGFKN